MPKNLFCYRLVRIELGSRFVAETLVSNIRCSHDADSQANGFKEMFPFL